jgi:hypothetical protein
MMLGTVRPTRHRSAARVSHGWLVRGVRHERDGCQLGGIHYPHYPVNLPLRATDRQEGEIRAVMHYEHRRGVGVAPIPRWRTNPAPKEP